MSVRVDCTLHVKQPALCCVTFIIIIITSLTFTSFGGRTEEEEGENCRSD